MVSTLTCRNLAGKRQDENSKGRLFTWRCEGSLAMEQYRRFYFISTLKTSQVRNYVSISFHIADGKCHAVPLNYIMLGTV